jgi:hypothetical protein
MAGLVPAIHDFLSAAPEDADIRVKPTYDALKVVTFSVTNP